MVDDRVYAERDQLRLLNSGEHFLQFFSANGISAVRDLLAAWAASHQASVNAAVYDWSPELANATMFCAEQFLGNHVCVEVSCKFCRDDLFRQLSVSPLHQTNWSDAWVTAQLIRLEQANRGQIMNAFLQPAKHADENFAAR